MCKSNLLLLCSLLFKLFGIQMLDVVAMDQWYMLVRKVISVIFLVHESFFQLSTKHTTDYQRKIVDSKGQQPTRISCQQYL
jgi:hypothetical protein